MLLRKITEKQVFFFMKLLAAVCIFYAWLNYAVLPVGEDFAQLIQKDYLELGSNIQTIETGDLVNQYIQQGIQELDASAVQSHSAASNKDVQYQDKFTTICSSNTDLCSIIDWVGAYTWQEKYLYISSIFSVTNFIQEYTLVGNDIVSVLRQITVNNDLWDSRGYASWNNIVFNLASVESRAEFVWLATHELWHVYDLWALQWVSSNKHAAFTEFGKRVFATDDLSLKYYANSWKSETIRKSGVVKKDFCSGYGMSDPFEDFAECFNLYINHNALFKTMAKSNQILQKKYNFVASMFDGNFLHAYESEVSYVKNNTARRPWDTTRIAN